MSDGQIVIDTRLNTDGVASGVNRIQSEAQKAGKAFDNAGEVAEREWGHSMRETTEETTQSVSSIKGKVESLSNGFSRLAKAIGVAFVVDKVKDFGHSILTAGINFDAMKEQSIAAWTTVLGSASAANDMFNQITKFAASTPFSQLGVDQMAKQLSNAGFKGQALFDQLSKFGDMGSAFSVQEDSLKEMVRQYSQVKMAGVAYTEDLNILADRSIPIYTALADVLHTNVANVKKMASQGKITADIYDKAINKIAESTKGGMEKQSLTLNGLISTLKDNMSVLAGELSKPIFDKLKNTLNSFLPTFQKFVDAVGKEGLVNALKEVFPQLKPLISVLENIGNFLTNVVLPTLKTLGSFLMQHAKVITILVGVLLSVNGVLKSVLAIDRFIKFGSSVKQAVNNINSFAKAVKASENLTGKFLNGIVKLAKGFGNLLVSIAKTTGKLVAQGAIWVAQKVKMLACAAAQKAVTAAQWLLNAAMDANPIGIIIIAITALVAGFIYLWKTSEGFRNFWIGLWNGIKSITKNVVTWIGNFFTQTIPKWINNIAQWFMQLPQKIGFALGYAAGKIYLWGQSVWNFFTVTIPQWINFIGQWFAKLPGEIWKWLVNTYNKVVAWGSNMIQKAIAVGTEFLNNIINWFSQLPGRIWAWLVDTYNKVSAWGSNLVQKAVETASNFINNFINWISQLPGRFMSWLSQTINNVIAWGRNLANAGLNAGKELVNSIVNTVKAIPGHMLSIGQDIVRGIWQGIINAKDWIVGKISGFASSIVSGFKSSLGIHSPARKLYSTGMYTIQGVQVGMENEMPNLNDQIEKQMTGMVGKMKATVKAQTSAQNFKASFGAMHMNMNKSFKLIGDNEKQPIVINLDEKHLLDGEVIAAHTTHKVIENISENQNSYLIATGGI